MSLGVGTDLLLSMPILGIAIWSGSLTLLADAMRACLPTLLELFAYVVMRRIHRGRLPSYQYGSGKIESFLNFDRHSARAVQHMDFRYRPVLDFATVGAEPHRVRGRRGGQHDPERLDVRDLLGRAPPRRLFSHRRTVKDEIAEGRLFSLRAETAGNIVHEELKLENTQFKQRRTKC